MEQFVNVGGGPMLVVRSGGLVEPWRECCTAWLSSGLAAVVRVLPRLLTE